jgi:hypothetical protein
MFDISFFQLAVVVTVVSYVVKKPELLKGSRLIGGLLGEN